MRAIIHLQTECLPVTRQGALGGGSAGVYGYIPSWSADVQSISTETIFGFTIFPSSPSSLEGGSTITPLQPESDSPRLYIFKVSTNVNVCIQFVVCAFVRSS